MRTMMALMGCVGETEKPGLRGATERNIEAVKGPGSRAGHKGVDIASLPLLLLRSISVRLSLQHFISLHLHPTTWLHETPHIVVNNIQ